ncbi:MAG: hypothetical protein ABI196_05385 [Bradyrhizobium sp.]
MKKSSGNIRTRDISGSGIAVGHGARANVRIGGEAAQKEMADLVAQLRHDITTSSLAPGAKSVLERGPVQDLEVAARGGDKGGVEGALKRANDTLEAAGATAEHVSGLAQTLVKIASAAGVGFKVTAPYLAALL